MAGRILGLHAPYTWPVATFTRELHPAPLPCDGMPPAGTTDGSERPCGTGGVGTTLALESRQAHLAGEVKASLIICLNDVKGAQLKSEIWTLVKSNKPHMRGVKRSQTASSLNSRMFPASGCQSLQEGLCRCLAGDRLTRYIPPA